MGRTDAGDNKLDRAYTRSRFRIALFSIILLLVFLRLADIFIYPDTEIVPADLFLALTIAQLFFLWFDEIKERQRLIWLHKEKDELNKMKAEFVMITSHELLTPVAILKLNIDIFLNGILGRLSNKQKDALKKMSERVEKLIKIKNDLSSIYHRRPDYFRQRFKSGSIEELIRDTVLDIEPFVRQRRLKLLVNVQSGIPDIAMSKRGIRQVLENLLLNSIRFTPDFGMIRLNATQEAEGIRVAIEDNGIGIPKEDIDTIFESFYEAQDADRHSSGSIEFKSAGMGLGLTIAKKIIKDHRGRIWAESEAGKFTRLTFVLPS